MTLDQARRVLNCIRDGCDDVHPELIREALRATGDLESRRPLQEEPVVKPAWPYYATVDGQQVTA